MYVVMVVVPLSLSRFSSNQNPFLPCIEIVDAIASAKVMERLDELIRRRKKKRVANARQNNNANAKKKEW
jgi:hypothetical protein